MLAYIPYMDPMGYVFDNPKCFLRHLGRLTE